MIDVNEQLFECNKKKIINLLKIIKNNKFYKEKYSLININEISNYEDFKKIPLLNKNEIQGKEEKLLNGNYDNDDLYIATTSGSEGKPLNCYMTKKTQFILSEQHWKIRRKFCKNLKFNDKVVQFYAARESKNGLITTRIHHENNRILFSLLRMNDEDLICYWNEILKEKPKWIHSVPSAVMLLANVIVKYNLEFYQFDLIELTGEYISDMQLEYIKSVFKCNVFNNYGLREFWNIAHGENSNKLEINVSNIFLEKIENKLFCTSLINKDWPLIRYEVGDNADIFLLNDKFYLSLYSGRESDYIILNDKRYNSIIFSVCIREFNKVVEEKYKILQYQIEKVNENKVLLYLNLFKSTSLKKSLENKLINDVRKMIAVENIVLDYNFSNRIKFSTGKLKKTVDQFKGDIKNGKQNK